MYPAVQFVDGEIIPGIPDVLAGMRDAAPWSILSFLLTEDGALDGWSPLAALQAGKRDEVLQIAAVRELDPFG